MNVRNTIINPNNTYSESCGKACIPDPDRPGELFVQFPAELVGDGKEESNSYRSNYTNLRLLHGQYIHRVLPV